MKAAVRGHRAIRRSTKNSQVLDDGVVTSQQVNMMKLGQTRYQSAVRPKMREKGVK